MRPTHDSTPNSRRTTLALLLAVAALTLLASSRLQGLLANTALLALGTLAISLPLKGRGPEGLVFGSALGGMLSR